MINIKPMIVTGVPRSGTTWIGKIISLSKQYHYVPEFINPDGGIYRNMKPFKWFQFINSENFLKFKKYFDELLNFQYVQSSIRLDKSLIEKLLNTIHYYQKKYLGYPQALLKEPQSCFSSEFLCNRLDLNVIIIIRHPAAVVNSFKRVGWNVDFSPILEQSTLVKEHLSSYETLMKNNPKDDVVGNVSILYLIIMDVLTKFINRNPDWIIVKHEELCNDPINEFKKLYKKLGLAFTKKIEKKIYLSTHGKLITPDKNMTFMFTRDSKSLINSWKTQLKREEIKRIRNIVNPIYNNYYDNEEW